MSCPNESCQNGFIAYYVLGGSIRGGNVFSGTFNGNITVGNLKVKTFNEHIEKNFPIFVKIYNEAYSAEQYNLLEICGVGYRKAVEYLIKDYCIKLYPDNKDAIEKIMLGKVIDLYVSEPKIKASAKRAVWLGNDETHYIRRWENKDLQDLKKLIDLTVLWIEMEYLSKEMESDMPE